MRQKLLKEEKCKKRSEGTVRQEEDNWQIMELIRGAAGRGPGVHAAPTCRHGGPSSLLWLWHQRVFSPQTGKGGKFIEKGSSQNNKADVWQMSLKDDGYGRCRAHHQQQRHSVLGRKSHLPSTLLSSRVEGKWLITETPVIKDTWTRDKQKEVFYWNTFDILHHVNLTFHAFHKFNMISYIYIFRYDWHYSNG